MRRVEGVGKGIKHCPRVLEHNESAALTPGQCPYWPAELPVPPAQPLGLTVHVDDPPQSRTYAQTRPGVEGHVTEPRVMLGRRRLRSRVRPVCVGGMIEEEEQGSEGEGSWNSEKRREGGDCERPDREKDRGMPGRRRLGSCMRPIGGGEIREGDGRGNSNWGRER